MKDDKWIEDLRKKEAEYEMPAPEGLWAGIDSRLKAASADRRPMPGRWQRRYVQVAAAALVAIVVGTSLFVHYSNSEGGNITKPLINIQTEAAIADGSRQLDSAHSGDENDAERGASAPLTKLIAKSTPITHMNMNLGTSELRDAENQDTITPLSPAMPGDDGKIADATCDRDETGQIDSYGDTTPEWGSRMRPRQHSKGNHNWRLVAFAGNVTTGAGNHTAGRGMNYAYSSSGPMSDPVMGQNPPEDFSTINQNKPVETRERHNMPLRFGVNISVPLRDRLSLETGLTYSILSSTLTAESQTSLCETHQKQHYLGLPIRLGYVLVQGGRWAVYSSAGGMVEKSVYGRSKSKLYMGTSPMATTTSGVSERELQLSVCAAVGMRCRVAMAVNVFLEPGVSYYFDNHSGVYNSYKDHPLNFDLKLGVSFDLK